MFIVHIVSLIIMSAPPQITNYRTQVTVRWMLWESAQACDSGRCAAKSCLTLCDPVDSRLPGSSVCGLLQARILEWFACPPPGDFPNPGTKPVSLTSPALAGRFYTTSTTWEAPPQIIRH